MQRMRLKESEVEKATENTPEARAQRRVKNFTDVMWHLATFIIVNGFLWFIDLRQDGLDWAYWVTIGWGIGLAFHIAFYFIGEEGTGNRRYQRILAEERRRDTDNPA
jgi:hypothetical protein